MFLRLVTLTCIVIFLLAEVQTPWQLGLIVVGIIARDTLQGWWRGIRDGDNMQAQWLYTHARHFASGAHDTWNPRKCQDCRHI